jgi:thiol-disulfide isomerase/thioredoxin
VHQSGSTAGADWKLSAGRRSRKRHRRNAAESSKQSSGAPGRNAGRQISDGVDGHAKGKSRADVEMARNAALPKKESFVGRALTLAQRHPGTFVGLVALKLVACRAAKTADGKRAAESLAAEVRTAELGVVAQAIPYPTYSDEQPIDAIAPIILKRVKKAPSHPQAARLLASVVCALSMGDDEAIVATQTFTEAADMILKRYTDSPDVLSFCELLGTLGETPNWSASFEKHLRTILTKNRDRAVRVAASFALASVVQGTGEKRAAEAEALYKEFLKAFDGHEKYRYTNIERMLIRSAARALVELKLRGPGKPAPDIDGVDLDGNRMKLSDYRGKVVLLSFWASWCGPCMQMVPHECELASRLAEKPFAIVGVNADHDPREAKEVAAKLRMTWRSFRDEAGPARQKISREWSVGFPTS